MKRPGDMKRRRHAAYHRGWNDALKGALARIEQIASGEAISAAVLRELREACHRPPPDLDDPAGLRKRSAI